MAKLGPQRRKKRWLLLIVPAAAVGWFLIFHPFGQQIVGKLSGGSCANPTFTTPPTVRDDFGYLVPLGNINPPDHTVPTDHVYYVFPGNPNEGHVPIYDVQTPANIHITKITYTSTLKGDEVQNFDYKVDFTPCGPVDAYYDHIHVLSPKLAAAFGTKPPCDDRHPRPGETYRYCSRDMYFAMKAGELVGQAGGAKAAGFDFGATDKRTPKLAFVGRHGGNKGDYTVCPFDLFADPLKSQLESKFQHAGPGPVCGEIMQDIAGTAQGEWHYGSSSKGPESWQDDLALVHDNRDTTKGVLAAGGRIGQSFRLEFQPTHSGTINRAFAEIKPASELYCYPNPVQGFGIGPNQQVVLQLLDATHLKIEMQTGKCATPYAFTSPTTYER